MQSVNKGKFVFELVNNYVLEKSYFALKESRFHESLKVLVIHTIREQKEIAKLTLFCSMLSSARQHAMYCTSSMLSTLVYTFWLGHAGMVFIVKKIRGKRKFINCGLSQKRNMYRYQGSKLQLNLHAARRHSVHRL